jgi:hypothetical protein
MTQFFADTVSPLADAMVQLAGAMTSPPVELTSVHTNSLSLGH